MQYPSFFASLRLCVLAALRETFSQNVLNDKGR